MRKNQNSESKSISTMIIENSVKTNQSDFNFHEQLEIINIYLKVAKFT